MRTIKTIFLSDDDADDCMLFSDALQKLYSEEEARLTSANEGVKPVEALNQNLPPPPEVIFPDLKMPSKNEFECLQEIRKTPKLQGIPIVMFSTSSHNNIVDRTYYHGANYCICKPKSYPLLKKTFEYVLSFDGSKLSPQPERENFVINIVC